MPSVQEIRALQRARKKARRRRMYLVGTLILVAIIAVSVVVYAYIQPGGTNTGSQAVVYAKLNTSQGLIEIELYQNATPKTVTNFVSLANSGFYNNLVWHRIAKNFVIQTGNSNSRYGLNNSTWSQPGTGQAIPFEYDNSLHGQPINPSGAMLTSVTISNSP